MVEEEKDKVCVCFKCEYSKSECSKSEYKGTKSCSFDKKANDLAINSLEIVAAKFADMKKEIHRRYTSSSIGRLFYIIQGELTPALDNFVTQEDLHDGNSLCN